MKKGIFFTMALALGAMTMMSSCQNDDRDNDCDKTGKVRFVSNVQLLQESSRVGGPNGNLWEGNEQIGIYMLQTGTLNISESNANIPYATTSQGETATFLPVGTTIYYPMDVNNKVDFLSYYPYSASVTDFVYNINVATQTDQNALDLMRSTIANNGGTGFDRTIETPVMLNFAHQMAKLVINVVPGADLTPADLTGLSLVINGMNTTNTYNISTGVFGTAANVAPITPNTVTADTQYEATLLPGALAVANTVVFTLQSGDTFVWNMSNDIPNLQSGNRYTYTVTLNRVGVQVQGNITPWTDNPGNGSANEDPTP